MMMAMLNSSLMRWKNREYENDIIRFADGENTWKFLENEAVKDLESYNNFLFVVA
jgi:hypothetical protein